MATTEAAVAGSSRGLSAAFLLKLVTGPLAFVVVMLLPSSLSYEGRVSLATFACAAVWWMTRPLPWAIAAMLPMIVFPAAGVMTIGATAGLYGNPIFFWIMGTVLIGYAIEKHGIAKRFALAFLALPGVAGQTRRLTLAYMMVTGLISMFVSDTATIAMMIPIGMSLVRHIRKLAGATTEEKTNFGAFMTLATFYAALAGGTATMVGLPHNAIAVSLLERFTGRSLGWFEWMVVGVPVFVALLISFYVLLWLMVPPEISHVRGGEDFIRSQRSALGPMTANQRRVLFVFGTMVMLFVLPTVVGLTLGERSHFSELVDRALPIWVVPPVLMFLLFAIPATPGLGDTLLDWKDAEQHVPWNVMILVLGAVAMTDALAKFGFVEFMGTLVGSLGLTITTLPYVAAAMAAVTTNFISGTAAAAMYCSIFIPAAVQTGYNPASIAILIANVSLGLALPWAGAAAATTFALGEIDMGRMIKVGIVTTVVFVMITSTIHLLLSPYI